MQTTMFQSIFAAEAASVIQPGKFLLCVGIALLIGVFLALMFTVKNRPTLSFLVTLAVLPAIVSVVIMMVNGNVGAGVAVAGAFSLVRFRSAPGTAREIGMIFLAMGTGLVCGMGYLLYAALFAVLVGGAMTLFTVAMGAWSGTQQEKTLRITIPEDLNYSDVFDDLFQEFTSFVELLSVKTTNMGSLYKLTYSVTLKKPAREKELIDALRCRNGNLEISMTRQEAGTYEL